MQQQINKQQQKSKMSYYPIHEPFYPDRYYYPHFAPHIHSQMANIYGLQVAKSQAEIDFLYQSNVELNQIHNRRMLYENITRQNIQRQIHLAKTIQAQKVNKQLERLRIRQSLIDEELFRQSELRRYHQQDMMMKQTYSRQFSNTKNGFQYVDHDKIRNSQSKAKENVLNKDNRQNDKNKSISHGEILNFRPKDYTSSIKQDNNNDDGEFNKHRSYKSQIKSKVRDISYAENKHSDKDRGDRESRQKSILKSNKKGLNIFQKSAKKVKFIDKIKINSSHDRSNKSNKSAKSPQQIKDDDSNQDRLKSKDKSVCLNNSKIKQAYRAKRIHSSPTKLKSNSRKNMQPLDAHKRIQNRIKLSSIVYIDSQYRNIKHQISHLFNTYDVEMNIRNQLKKKFNEDPKIIAKFSLVSQS